MLGERFDEFVNAIHLAQHFDRMKRFTSSAPSRGSGGIVGHHDLAEQLPIQNHRHAPIRYSSRRR
jgi:hypothetical protein